MDLEVMQLNRPKTEAETTSAAKDAVMKANAEANKLATEVITTKAELATKLQKARDVLANLKKTFDTVFIKWGRYTQEVVDLKKGNGELAN